MGGVQAQRALRRSLERLLRLSFHQNLLHRLPEAVHVYVPPEPLAVSNLPVQAKPEFAKMVGVARIKDPQAEKVLKFCQRLLKVAPKEELKEAKLEVTNGTALPVLNEEGKEKESADGESGLKRDRAMDAAEANGEPTQPETKCPRVEESAGTHEVA